MGHHDILVRQEFWVQWVLSTISNPLMGLARVAIYLPMS
jgi:hypothetical protein